VLSPRSEFRPTEPLSLQFSPLCVGPPLLATLFDTISLSLHTAHPMSPYLTPSLQQPHKHTKNSQLLSQRLRTMLCQLTPKQLALPHRNTLSTFRNQRYRLHIDQKNLHLGSKTQVKSQRTKRRLDPSPGQLLYLDLKIRISSRIQGKQDKLTLSHPFLRNPATKSTGPQLFYPRLASTPIYTPTFFKYFTFSGPITRRHMCVPS